MSDKQRFSALMDDLGLVYDKAVSVELKRLYWDDLGHLPIDAIESAMRAHRRDPERGRFWPRPADIIGRCATSAGHHPSADAAWPVALESFDEEASVVLTDAIAQARAAAMPVWDAGDKVGARMAFKAAYEQILAALDAPPRWYFSAGHDPARRAEAAERALQQGLVPRQEVARYLPAPAMTDEGRRIAGLLTGNVLAHPASGDERTRARLADLQRALAQAEAQKAGERAARERQQDEAAKARHAQRHGLSPQERAQALEAEMEERKKQQGAA